jgi:hypothetical protein
MTSYVYGCGPCCEWNSRHSSLLGRMAEAMGRLTGVRFPHPRARSSQRSLISYSSELQDLQCVFDLSRCYSYVRIGAFEESRRE